MKSDRSTISVGFFRKLLHNWEQLTGLQLFLVGFGGTVIATIALYGISEIPDQDSRHSILLLIGIMLVLGSVIAGIEKIMKHPPLPQKITDSEPRVSEGFERLSIVVGAVTALVFFSFIAATKRRWDLSELTLVSLGLGIAGASATYLIVWTIKWVIEGFTGPSSHKN